MPARIISAATKNSDVATIQATEADGGIFADIAVSATPGAVHVAVVDDVASVGSGRMDLINALERIETALTNIKGKN